MRDKTMDILNLGDVLLRHLHQLGRLNVPRQVSRAVFWRRGGVLILISVFLTKKTQNIQLEFYKLYTLSIFILYIALFN